MDFQIFDISTGVSMLSAVITFITLGCTASFILWGVVQGVMSIRRGLTLIVDEV